MMDERVDSSTPAIEEAKVASGPETERALPPEARQQGWRPPAKGPATIVAIIAIGVAGVLAILYAWQLPPFAGWYQETDNAYVRGRVTVISPQVSGYITQVAVRDFQQVKRGDVLATIDDRIYGARVEQAKANVAAQLASPDPITIWSIGGSVLAPLFEGGRLRAGVEAAAAQRDQAAESYRRAALTAFREVDDALAGVVSADEQLRIGLAQRDALAESYRLARNRYRAGYSPFLEELDAQRGLLAAELSLVQTRSDALTNRVALYRALGGGWSGAELMR